MKSPSPLLLTAALASLLGGCQQLLGYEAASVDGRAVRDLSTPRDADAVPDGAVDASPPPSLRCDRDVAQVGDKTPEGYVEPAVRPDGLSVVARRLGGPAQEMAVTSRAGLDQPFGPWTPVAGQAVVGDLCFFPGGPGSGRVLGAEVGVVERKLLLCDWLAPCGAEQALSLAFDAPPPGTDLDGPDLFADGQRLLFNAASEPLAGKVFLAARDADGSWKARQLVELDMDGLREDDPAISADGRIVVFAAGADGLDDADDLWYAARRDEAAPFSAPRPIASAAINDPVADEQAPDISHAPASSPGTLELFFASDRGRPGLGRIYRTTCKVEVR